MVKRIKKRIPKPETPNAELDAAGVEVEGADEGALAAEGAGDAGYDASYDSPESEGAPRAFRAPIVIEPSISMTYNDGFLDASERFFHAVYAQWQVLVAVAAVGALVWGVKVKLDTSAHEAQAEERVALAAAAASYREARAPQVAYLKRGARWAEENPAALTTPDIGAAPTTESLKGAAERVKALQGELSHDGARALARLGEASARFDAASTSADFNAAAALYAAVSADGHVEPFARAVAQQSAAASYEQAALRAGDEESKRAAWASAAAAWDALSKLDPEVYGLFAGVSRAQVLVAAGDFAAAASLVANLETVHAEALKDPKRKADKRALTLVKAQAAR